MSCLETEQALLLWLPGATGRGAFITTESFTEILINQQTSSYEHIVLEATNKYI